MDPFGPVLLDAEQQLSTAQSLLNEYRASPSATTLHSLQSNLKDISDVIRELTQSIAAAQSRPEQFGLSSHDIHQRIEQVGHINKQVTDIQEALAAIKQESRQAGSELGSDLMHNSNPFSDSNAEVSQEDRQMLFQTTLTEQDTILDEVEQTVSNLREQANLMSGELDDQVDLIDDFETRVDHTNNRIARGLRHVDYVLRNNRDTANNCCIGLLIVILTVLLILVVIS